MLVQRLHLEGDRARIIGVEHREVADRRERRRDQIARAVGDLAVHQRQQDIEVLVGGLVIGELPREAQGVDGALGAAAHFEEAPAGGPVHVLLGKAREARQFLQGQFRRAQDAVIVVDLFGEPRRHLGDDLPGIRRQPLAQGCRGALGGADEREARAEALVRSAAPRPRPWRAACAKPA